MTTPAQPRHARAEIRAFAKWMKDQGWVYQRTDSIGHTIWAHPKASGHYKLPETPSHFNVKRARGDVERLLGIKHQGKHRGKPKVSAPRRDFALEQLRREADERARAEQRAKAEAERRAESQRQAVAARPAPPSPRVTRRLPWEDQPDNYDRGLARLMSTPPGSH